MDDVKKKINNMINNKRFRIVVKFFVILLFVVISLLVANKHEHWSDEAQSFLLARDTSMTEIFKYMKYEGTPPLWVLVIKLFIFLGGTYETFFILPIIFSTIGVILFEYKSNAPWYIKLLFPFTYFLIYQYTIVARSYCLIFPLLMLITIIYKDRFNKCFLFSIVLFLFMNISLHSLVIAGSFYLIYIIESISTKKIEKRQVLITIGILFLEFLLTVVITYPASDCSYGTGSNASLFHIISEATIGSNLNIYVEIIISIIIFGILFFTLSWEKKINFLVIILPILFVFIFIKFLPWHAGIMWLLLFICLIISGQINNNMIVKVFVVFVCFVQIGWTLSSIHYDFNNRYSASGDVANYLDDYVDENKIIYGLGYSKTAILPYFEENIFNNVLTDKSFYIWAKDNKELSINESYNLDVDVYVISEFYLNNYTLMQFFLESNNYRKIEFKGNTYNKNNIYESEGYVVYEKVSA